MNNHVPTTVDCYSGYRDEETPRRFTFKGQIVEVDVVVDRWRTPKHRSFKVRPATAESYTLAVTPLRDREANAGGGLRRARRFLDGPASCFAGVRLFPCDRWKSPSFQA